MAKKGIELEIKELGLKRDFRELSRLDMVLFSDEEIRMAHSESIRRNLKRKRAAKKQQSK